MFLKHQRKAALILVATIGGQLMCDVT